jgi:hypothetical protein
MVLDPLSDGGGIVVHAVGEGPAVGPEGGSTTLANVAKVPPPPIKAKPSLAARAGSGSPGSGHVRTSAAYVCPRADVRPRAADVGRQSSSVSRVAKMLNHANPKPSLADVVISHVRHTRGHAKLPKIVTCLHW